MSRKKHPGNCYLCGEYDTHLTKDHIPPECFSPNPIESFTLTSTPRFDYAYACRECNEYYSKIEKTFKNVMLMASPGNIQAADDAWEKLVSENRKSFLEHGKLSKEVRHIMQNFLEREVYTPNNIYLGKRLGIHIPNDSFYTEEFIKIAKGLHYVHTKEIIPKTHEGFVRLNEQIIYFKEFENAPYTRFTTDFFTYMGAATQDSKSSMWYMQFYRGTLAQVWFRPKK